MTDSLVIRCKLPDGEAFSVMLTRELLMDLGALKGLWPGSEVARLTETTLHTLIEVALSGAKVDPALYRLYIEDELGCKAFFVREVEGRFHSSRE